MEDMGERAGLREPDAEEKSLVCGACGECCRSFSFDMKKPSDWDEGEIVRWLKERGVKVVRDDGDCFRIRLQLDCPHISDEAPYRCDIYETRPEVCRKFDGRMHTGDGLECAWEKYE